MSTTNNYTGNARANIILQTTEVANVEAAGPVVRFKLSLSHNLMILDEGSIGLLLSSVASGSGEGSTLLGNVLGLYFLMC